VRPRGRGRGDGGGEEVGGRGRKREVEGERGPCLEAQVPRSFCRPAPPHQGVGPLARAGPKGGGRGRIPRWLCSRNAAVGASSPRPAFVRRQNCPALRATPRRPTDNAIALSRTSAARAHFTEAAGALPHSHSDRSDLYPRRRKQTHRRARACMPAYLFIKEARALVSDLELPFCIFYYAREGSPLAGAF
jgi:hypothetical protein